MPVRCIAMACAACSLLLLSQVQLINDVISIEESAKERRAAGDKVPKEDKAMANLLTDAAAGKAIDGEESQAVMQAHREECW